MLVIGGALITSCSVSKPLYTWADYDKTSYDYLKKHDEASAKSLETTYETIVNGKSRFKKASKNKNKKTKVAPGVYADYGYLLLKKGNTKKALEMFQLEKVTYPESSTFIDAIIKKITNDKS